MIKYLDEKNTYIDETVTIEDGSVIYPNVVIEGNTKIGKNCLIHFGTYIKDSIIGDNCVIYNSFIINSQIGNDSSVGPFAHIRSNNLIHDNVHIGSFVELKNSDIGNNSKVPHLSYVGDTKIGEKVNIGAGAVVANYDGKKKHQTVINNEAFIGSNTTLIAPLEIGENSLIAAGSTITDDVPDNCLAIARQYQQNKDC